MPFVWNLVCEHLVEAVAGAHTVKYAHESERMAFAAACEPASLVSEQVWGKLWQMSRWACDACMRNMFV